MAIKTIEVWIDQIHINDSKWEFLISTYTVQQYYSSTATLSIYSIHSIFKIILHILRRGILA